jgi:hypothetical protein
MRQTRRNVERKGRVGELGYEASKVSSGSPERSGTGRDEDFTLKGVAALTTVLYELMELHMKDVNTVLYELIELSMK